MRRLRIAMIVCSLSVTGVTAAPAPFLAGPWPPVTGGAIRMALRELRPNRTHPAERLRLRLDWENITASPQPIPHGLGASIHRPFDSNRPVVTLVFWFSDGTVFEDPCEVRFADKPGPAEATPPGAWLSFDLSPLHVGRILESFRKNNYQMAVTAISGNRGWQSNTVVIGRRPPPSHYRALGHTKYTARGLKEQDARTKSLIDELERVPRQKYLLFDR